MKLKLSSLLLVAVFLFTKINAQVMAKKPEWVTFKSPNLKCWICKEKLAKYLDEESKANYESGIAQMKFNVLQGEVKIQYYPDRITPDDIREAINNAGFDTETTKATEDSYKKLPPQCKRAEDGGGPKKGKPCHVEPSE